MARDEVVNTTNGQDIPMYVRTICTHGDTQGSHELTRLLREGLEREGIKVRAVGSP
jgi:lactam utilization protein B